MQTENQASIHVPTLRQRILRRLGYRYHLGDAPVGGDVMQGWMRTDIRLHFGWADRLRLLATGRLFIASIVHTDTPSPAVCKSRVDWMIETGEARRG